MNNGLGIRFPYHTLLPLPGDLLPIAVLLGKVHDLHLRLPTNKNAPTRIAANHIGDIAKDHPALAFNLCERWLDGASAERRWLIRHALRHPARHSSKTALRLRRLAG